jgi:large subunit ribosomal protein L18
MSVIKRMNLKRARRAARVRAKVRAQGRLRISVFRSLRYIYGQVIDDVSGKTLASCSSLELDNLTGDKTAIAKSVGLELSKRVNALNIAKELTFDRGSYLYHGRVKAFADGLREGGLNF